METGSGWLGGLRLAGKPDDLGLSPRAHRAEGKNPSHKSYPLTSQTGPTPHHPTEKGKSQPWPFKIALVQQQERRRLWTTQARKQAQ